MSVIGNIIAATEGSIREREARVPLSELKRRVKDAPRLRSFGDALSHGFGIIAEIKTKSPTAGAMDQQNVSRAPAVYDSHATVVAISVLTEGPFFGGSLELLSAIRKVTSKPILRKDFIIDEYQVWEARAYGADAILLMASLSIFAAETQKLTDLFALARDLGLDALCEVGMASRSETLEEIAKRVPRDARIWGINSRSFVGTGLRIRARLGQWLRKDFMTKRNRHERLRGLVPQGRVAIAESGIHAPDDLDDLVRLRYDAALIGTAFLKGPRPVADVVAAFDQKVRAIRAVQGSAEAQQEWQATRSSAARAY